MRPSLARTMVSNEAWVPLSSGRGMVCVEVVEEAQPANKGLIHIGAGYYLNGSDTCEARSSLVQPTPAPMARGPSEYKRPLGRLNPIPTPAAGSEQKRDSEDQQFEIFEPMDETDAQLLAQRERPRTAHSADTVGARSIEDALREARLAKQIDKVFISGSAGPSRIIGGESGTTKAEPSEAAVSKDGPIVAGTIRARPTVGVFSDPRSRILAGRDRVAEFRRRRCLTHGNDEEDNVEDTHTD
jgi:hypothetical protein